jgi:hypothetical protein
MKAITLLRLLTVSLTAVLALLPLSVALASPPVIQTFHDQGTQVVPVTPCGFSVVLDFTEDDRVTTFFDQSGNPVKLQVHVQYYAKVINPANGKSVIENDSFTIIFNLLTGSAAYSGTEHNVNLPGAGIVLLDAGRVIFDANGNITFERGPKQFLNGDFQAFCSALSDP